MNLEAVLQDDTKMVSMILPSNIRLEKGYKDIHATVYGSATQLHQVLLNLAPTLCRPWRARAAP